ncbi:GtrA family protein [Roseovarius faecimaris]|uniref:GtrA family protein n=1 Tax=Roseovarius faecimaris TaxID=2494550 RepID=A0A6I6IK55_9RHOB|nr:GtrA family protein [Roseovarius faecimaris]QGX97209.1 GtrA family protein [Roseovarius faecimaris]
MSGLGQYTLFFFVSLMGLCIDVAIAWLVHTMAGVALPLAALIGFSVAAAFNYVQHARWTFSGSRRSLRGFTAYLALQTVAAGLRIALVAWFELVPALAPYPLITLIAATAVTFLVNFALSLTLIFRPARNEVTEQDNE